MDIVEDIDSDDDYRVSDNALEDVLLPNYNVESKAGVLNTLEVVMGIGLKVDDVASREDFRAKVNGLMT